MKFKATFIFNFTQVRMAIIKNKSISAGGYAGKKMEDSFTVGENSNWYSHCGNQCE